MKSGRLCRAAVAFVLVLIIDPVTAAAAEESVDRAFLDLLNRARIEAGRTPLTMEPSMRQLAIEWSGTLMTAQQLSHRTQSSQTAWIESRMTPNWQRTAENVASGYSVDAVHAWLMASPGHRANMLGDFTHVGIGSMRDVAGRLWVTFNFVAAPGLDGTTRVAWTDPGRRDAGRAFGH
jgi:uncharacterized protein YkwD